MRKPNKEKPVTERRNTVQILLRMHPDAATELRARATAEGMTIAGYVTHLVMVRR